MREPARQSFAAGTATLFSSRVGRIHCPLWQVAMVRRVHQEVDVVGEGVVPLEVSVGGAVEAVVIDEASRVLERPARKLACLG